MTFFGDFFCSATAAQGGEWRNASCIICILHNPESLKFLFHIKGGGYNKASKNGQKHTRVELLPNLEGIFTSLGFFFWLNKTIHLIVHVFEQSFNSFYEGQRSMMHPGVVKAFIKFANQNKPPKNDTPKAVSCKFAQFNMEQLTLQNS